MSQPKHAACVESSNLRKIIVAILGKLYLSIKLRGLYFSEDENPPRERYGKVNRAIQ